MRRLAGLLAVLAVPSTLAGQAPPRADAPRPTLVVYLTVDQMRSDYVDRWASQLTGGLARLRSGGAFFVNAYQDHGVTETAPGHSVTLSGRFPRSTGILRNTAGVEDAQAPLLTSRDPGASPYRFRGSTLIDWMRARDPRSRALSISRKDRGAILPMGRAKQSVFWYATSNGEFTTSRYYGDTLPTWIRRFNERRTPQRLAGQSWDLLLAPDRYAEPDSEPLENNGRDVTFPHLLPSDTVRAASELPYTPWMDRLTLDAALAGVEALQLGKGPQPDVLAISLSATDYVGHRYGPDSREQHDNILRLDRALGTFIDSLYRLRDSSTIVFALGADHGVTSYPALAVRRKQRRAEVRYDTRPAAATLKSVLRAARVDENAITMDGPLVYVDRYPFALAHVDPEPILQRFVAALRATPGIVRVDGVRELAKRDTVRDDVSRRWYHMIPPDSPVEFVITAAEGAYPADANIAEHGAPYDDDAHVPLLFYGPWFKGGRYAERALIADIAPTLAQVLGVSPTERLDGRARTAIIIDPRRR